MSVMACARCGQEPRAADLLYICHPCWGDATIEARRAEKHVTWAPGETREQVERRQREYLVDMLGWAGWHVRLRTSQESARAVGHGSGAPLSGVSTSPGGVVTAR